MGAYTSEKRITDTRLATMTAGLFDEHKVVDLNKCLVNINIARESESYRQVILLEHMHIQLARSVSD